jgi:predicted nucleic acid-binding protein
VTVIDTCVLSSLAKIDRLGLLRTSFENIIATPSVVNEIEEVGETEFVKRIKEALYFEEIEEEKFIRLVAI